MWSVVSKLEHMRSLAVQMEPRVTDGCPHAALFLHKTLRSLKPLRLALTFSSSSAHCCQGRKTIYFLNSETPFMFLSGAPRI